MSKTVTVSASANGAMRTARMYGRATDNVVTDGANVIQNAPDESPPKQLVYVDGRTPDIGVAGMPRTLTANASVHARSCARFARHAPNLAAPLDNATDRRTQSAYVNGNVQARTNAERQKPQQPTHS